MNDLYISLLNQTDISSVEVLWDYCIEHNICMGLMTVIPIWATWNVPVSASCHNVGVMWWSESGQNSIGASISGLERERGSRNRYIYMRCGNGS